MRILTEKVYYSAKTDILSGNHDITLDQDFYMEHGQSFHNQNLQDPQVNMNLVKSFHGIHMLNHEYKEIDMHIGSGRRTCLRVFGSPYSPRRGHWAFGYDTDMASTEGGTGMAPLWNHVPLNTDILVTHTPPKSHCDEFGGEARGCESLRQALWRIRPSLAICGHVHEGRGVERVSWDLSSSNVSHKEDATDYWDDPSLDNKKQSLINLTAKGTHPLRNRGPCEMLTGSPIGLIDQDTPEQPKFDAGQGQLQGLGGDPRSIRRDVEALDGRLERKETCIVNAAIMATSWPYKTTQSGRRKYNKAIVVDLDLPTWESSMGIQPDESEAHQSHQ